jgi:eukaryotic-like serine/threonine-protein kinase
MTAAPTRNDLIRPRVPTPVKERTGLTTGIPADMLRDMAGRLGTVGLVFAVAEAVGIAVTQMFAVLGWNLPVTPAERIPVSTTGLVLGLVINRLARLPRLRPAHLLAIGLAFEVIGGFLVVLPEAYYNVVAAPPGHTMMVSWLTVWIAVFPILLPATPGITVVASLGTAMMAPLATLLVVAFSGWPWPPVPLLMGHFIPNFTVSLLMLIPARAIHRMRHDVSEARAMGSYRLEEKLGSGGMGEVWRATHHTLARPAAIKLIGAEALASSTPEEVEALRRRFELEAQATASLGSPHTVALYDFGVSDDGRFYYVMELLDGLDFDRLVRAHGPLPPARVAFLLIQACESLAEAHARGMVHRDIKPSNLYACRLGGRHDFVKILDFGLVRNVSAPAGNNPRLTMGPVALGTPPFMSPEMVMGQSVDARSDLYALGCVAYWLLTGTEVFAGRSAVEIMSLHAHAPAEPPSKRVAGIPAALESVVLSCLEKSPAARPASATAISDALSSVALGPPWTEAQAAVWWSQVSSGNGNRV